MIHHIIHHNDLDGDAAAAVVQLYLTARIPAKFHRVTYGDSIPGEIDFKVDYVWIVDFSYEPWEVMESLFGRLGDRLTWIDHHDSSLKMERDSRVVRQIPGLRATQNSTGKLVCGAELTWTYLFPETPQPTILDWVGDWDTWRAMRGDRAPDVWAFNTKMYELKLFPEKRFDWWMRKLALNPGLIGEAYIRDEIVKPGRVFVDYDRKKNRGLLYGQGFEATLVTPDKEYPVLAVNSNGSSLMFLDYFNPMRHSGMLKFFFTDPDHLTVGIYSDDSEKLNCAEVCYTLGHSGPTPSGGGHPSAGGFLTTWAHFQTLLKDTTTLKVLGKKIHEPKAVTCRTVR